MRGTAGQVVFSLFFLRCSEVSCPSQDFRVPEISRLQGFSRNLFNHGTCGVCGASWWCQNGKLKWKLQRGSIVGGRVTAEEQFR